MCTGPTNDIADPVLSLLLEFLRKKYTEVWCPEGTSGTHLAVPLFSLGQGTLQRSNPACSVRCWGKQTHAECLQGLSVAVQCRAHADRTLPSLGGFPESWRTGQLRTLVFCSALAISLRVMSLFCLTCEVLCLTGLRQLIRNLCKAVVNWVSPPLLCLHTKSNTKSSISHPSLSWSHGIQFKPKISTKET